MTDELPSYLRAPHRGTKIKLRQEDLPGGKPDIKIEKGEVLFNRAARVIDIGQKTTTRIITPDWLLTGEPREVQLEALRRSYYGQALYDGNPLEGDFSPNPRIIRPGLSPAPGWGHFLQMRLGKTPIALNEFSLLRRDYGFKIMLVLSPNAYKNDWVEESEKFGFPLPAMAYDATNKKAVQRFIAKHMRTGFLLSVNYEAIGFESTMEILELLCGEDTAIYADESIFIKGHDSRMTINALALAKKCGVRRPMTGKPVTQGAHDLWSQLRFAGQIEGFNFFAWKNTYCLTGGFKKKQIIGLKNEGDLQKLLQEGSFVARRSNWLKTPGVEYGDKQISMLPAQAEHYAKMNRDFLTELEDGTIVSADQAITKFLKLAQISSGFIIDENKVAHDLMPLDKNPKMQTIRKLMEDQIDAKVIIFAHHTHTLDLLEQALAPWQPAIIRSSRWHKKMGRPVEDEKRRFNGEAECRVTIGQIQAIRYGHTLMGAPGDPCLFEIWAENNFSLNDRSQGEERPQGSGQEGPITIFDLYTSPQERKTVKSIQAKEDIASIVMNYAREFGILPRNIAPPSEEDLDYEE